MMNKCEVLNAAPAAKEAGAAKRKAFFCHLTALLLLICLVPLSALGEMEWKQDTPAQQLLKTYVEKANEFLLGRGKTPINHLFEMYNGFAVLGITETEDALIPEGVELTVKLYASSINSLELRVSELDAFTDLAAAFIWALNPEEMTAEEALSVPKQKVQRVQKAPQSSFEESVEELNGANPCIYYAYFPDQYGDGNNWMQMTVIFPLAGAWDGSGLQNASTATDAPDSYSGSAEGYEGYYAQDEYAHLEVFLTPAPDTDTPGAEAAREMEGK